MGRARARTGVICAAPFCLSSCFPGCGVRFHPFPNNVKKRNKWLNILKISLDDYKEDMMICNTHFNNADFLNNDCKKGKLRAAALPHFSKKEKSSDSYDLVVNSLDIQKGFDKFKQVSASNDIETENYSDEVVDFSSDDEYTEKERLKKKLKSAKLKTKAAKNKTKTDITSVNKIINEIFEENDTANQNLYEITEFTEPYDVLTHVCRICLATGCAMYSMNEFNLEPTYLLLTGINSDMFDETKMPQMLCFECVQRLQNFIQFSTKSLTSWSFLNELIEKDKLSMDEIKGLDREKNMLSSTLGYKIFEPNYYDLKIQEYDDDENKVFTSEEQNESMVNVKVTNEDHKQSMENSIIDDEIYLEMSVDDENDASITVIKENEEHGNSVLVHPNENRLSIENENPDKNENPSKNLYSSDNDEPSDGEDFFSNPDKNITEKKYPSKDAEDNSDDDILYNSKGKKKFSKRHIREFEEIFEEKSLTTEMQKAVLESRKNTQRYKKSVFTCDKCFMAFNFEETFKEHMKRHTNECGEFVCPVCQAHYFTRSTMARHVRNQHEKWFQCRLCPFKTTQRGSALVHRRFHDGKRYQCEKCPRSFVKPSPYRAHKQLYHPEDAVCHLCGESLAGFRALAQHMLTAHRGEDPKLPPTKSLNALYGMESVRKKETASAHTLAYFVTTLPDDSPCCDQCEIRFLDKSAIQRHFAVSPLHGNPHKKRILGVQHKKRVTVNVICEQCGVECGGFRKYARHFSSEHPGLNRTQYPGKYLCELCGKVLQSKTFLNEHKKEHGDRGARNILVCDICGAHRSSKSSMYTHKRDHRLSRKCEICKRVLASVSGLVKHVRLHTFDKPYACQICNKRFSMPSLRKSHITHTHMGVPWPKKKKQPKEKAPLLQRGRKSVVDMKEIEQCTEQSAVTQEAEEE